MMVLILSHAKSCSLNIMATQDLKPFKQAKYINAMPLPPSISKKHASVPTTFCVSLSSCYTLKLNSVD